MLLLKLLLYIIIQVGPFPMCVVQMGLALAETIPAMEMDIKIGLRLGLRSRPIASSAPPSASSIHDQALQTLPSVPW